MRLRLQEASEDIWTGFGRLDDQRRPVAQVPGRVPVPDLALALDPGVVLVVVAATVVTHGDDSGERSPDDGAASPRRPALWMAPQSLLMSQCVTCRSCWLAGVGFAGLMTQERLSCCRLTDLSLL